MYTTTREEAAVMLWLSTRSIDRYIRNWKLRSQKVWKIVYINSEDIDNFLNGDSKKQVILNKNDMPKETQTTQLKKENTSSNQDFVAIFNVLKDEIDRKDWEIKHLSMQIGKMEEVVKNSISLIEFKKNQYLLEESKKSMAWNLEDMSKQLEEKKVELKQEKKNNFILLILLLILFIAIIVVWVVSI